MLCSRADHIVSKLEHADKTLFKKYKCMVKHLKTKLVR